jgi:thiol:disulfide interchange protein
MPDEEERAKLENNIQTALSAGLIGLDDAIDIRNISNIKTANEFLKVRQAEKAKRDQEAQQANIAAQAQANSQLAQQTALAETQKQQVLTEQKIQLEQAKMQFNIQQLQQEANIKKQLMGEEFSYNMQLAEMNTRSQMGKENNKEDRKDDRAKLVATQQSELINQRQNNAPPKNFESSGMDVLGGFGLEQFEPK